MYFSFPNCTGGPYWLYVFYFKMSRCSNIISAAVIRHPGRKQLRSSQSQVTVCHCGNSRQELEVISQIHSQEPREIVTCSLVRLAFPRLHSLDPVHEMVTPSVRVAPFQVFTGLPGGPYGPFHRPPPAFPQVQTVTG